MEMGTVKYFNRDKGYGFIGTEQSNDIFAHQTDILIDGFRTLEVGQTVSFDLETTERGLKARNISPVWESEENV